MNMEKNLHYYLCNKFDVHPFIIHYLFSKGFDNEEKIERFLFSNLLELHSPFLFKDMKKAIERVLKAIYDKEKIVIFGDYDVDGITSTSMLYNALLSLNANVSFQIPLREEGYGLSTSFVERFCQEKIRLIITVDNGTSSFEAIQKANELGIDVIVTDHHEITGFIPPAFAFINPKNKDEKYPFKHLSGAGVTFKFIQGLFHLSNVSPEKIWDYIELCTFGTIADMMDMTEENRVLCQLGIQKMNINPSLPFHLIKEKIGFKSITSTDISFSIAPIFNSVGRIHNPNIAVKFFTTNPTNQALSELIELNKRRKILTEEQFELSKKEIERKRLYEKPYIVTCNDYHDGIIGILASKIANKYKKPSFVVSYNGKGSARNHPSSTLSIVDLLKRCSPHLRTFGGHVSAGGFSLSLNQIESFIQTLHQIPIKEQNKRFIYRYDGILPIHSFPFTLFHDLQLLEPFGVGFEKPIFLSPNSSINQIHYFGKNKQFTKLKINQYNLISFSDLNMNETQLTKQPFHFLYSIHSKNHFLLKDIVEQNNKKQWLQVV